jgi:hypothetical protein
VVGLLRGFALRNVAVMIVVVVPTDARAARSS